MVQACVGLGDGTFLRTCRPQDEEEEKKGRGLLQRAHYSGYARCYATSRPGSSIEASLGCGLFDRYKKSHGVHWQVIALPNGLIGSLDGPYGVLLMHLVVLRLTNPVHRRSPQ